MDKDKHDKNLEEATSEIADLARDVKNELISKEEANEQIQQIQEDMKLSDSEIESCKEEALVFTPLLVSHKEYGPRNVESGTSYTQNTDESTAQAQINSLIGESDENDLDGDDICAIDPFTPGSRELSPEAYVDIIAESASDIID